jgi:hypothetical protein
MENERFKENHSPATWDRCERGENIINMLYTVKGIISEKHMKLYKVSEYFHLFNYWLFFLVESWETEESIYLKFFELESCNSWDINVVCTLLNAIFLNKF